MGRWQFDPETVTLFDATSGQNLRFEGVVPERPFWLFRYRDPDIQYPIVVSGWPDRFAPNQGNTWTIDHRASAARWRAESGLRWPPYGLWRRVELAVSDALLCWPECDATGPLPWKFVSLGGWFNGQWSRRIVRSRDRVNEASFEADEPETPSLGALTAQPHTWRYVDVSAVAPGADLVGTHEIAPERLYYPRDREPGGYQQTMPHLVRDDGKAAMFPSGLSSYMYRFESYRAGAYFVYVDDDVFFRFDGGDGLGRWEFKLRDLKRIGLRDTASLTPAGLPASLFRGWRMNEPWGQSIGPSPRLWETVSEALIDGWLAWTGNPGRLLDDPAHLNAMAEDGPCDPPPLAESGIGLNQKSRVEVQGGYVGGRFNRIFTTEAWLRTET